jgi:hypothetical protein
LKAKLHNFCQVQFVLTFWSILSLRYLNIFYIDKSKFLEGAAAAVVVVIAKASVLAVLAASTSQQLPLLSLPFLTLFHLPRASCHAYMGKLSCLPGQAVMLTLH